MKSIFQIETAIVLLFLAANAGVMDLHARDLGSLSGEAGNSALVPVKFRGRAFFPIGVFDLACWKTPRTGRLFQLDPNLYECGVNCAFFGTFGMPDDKMYPGADDILKALEENRKDPRFEKLALIIQIAPSLYCSKDEDAIPGNSRRCYRPLNRKEQADCAAVMEGIVRKFSHFPNIVGYSYDEPENTFNQFFQRTKGKRNLDRGIAAALHQYLGWIRPLVRKNHPGALLMPIIAWWGTYEYVSPLYDVLIANQYPRSETKSEFSGPLYEVSYDAGRAVEAARRHGKTVVYMPPSFDVLPGKWVIATRKELRYMYFAPIVRGAMGVIGWRLNRCSQSYRENVLYPVLKEVSHFREFYLGEWHDGLISSNRDRAAADYLKNFSVRSRLVQNEEDGEFRQVADPVPDVSHCLRRHGDGRWMLLAVSNRREPQTVRFRLNLSELPSEIEEFFSGKKVGITSEGVLFDDFAPFAVHIYVFTGKRHDD